MYNYITLWTKIQDTLDFVHGNFSLKVAVQYQNLRNLYIYIALLQIYVNNCNYSAFYFKFKNTVNSTHVFSLLFRSVVISMIMCCQLHP